MKLLLATALSIALVAPAIAIAGPAENLNALNAAAARIRDTQFADGAYPWIIGEAGKYQNIQGITALGVLDAYEITLDASYLESAAKNRDWLAAYMAANPGAYISSSNVFFLAEYALVTGELADLELARAAYDTAIARFGSPAGIVTGIVSARAAQGHTNLGLWDAALFVRAAQDIGAAADADEMATTMREQTIVDPMNANANWYEMGLSGLLFGYGEAGALDDVEGLLAVRDALLGAQCENGSFPTTWQGVVYCDDVQSTAYAVDGLTYVGSLIEAQAGCDFLAASQASTGGWDLGGYEVAEINAEAASALAQCLLPARNAVTSYADELVAHV